MARQILKKIKKIKKKRKHKRLGKTMEKSFYRNKDLIFAVGFFTISQLILLKISKKQKPLGD